MRLTIFAVAVKPLYGGFVDRAKNGPKISHLLLLEINQAAFQRSLKNKISHWSCNAFWFRLWSRTMLCRWTAFILTIFLVTPQISSQLNLASRSASHGYS